MARWFFGFLALIGVGWWLNGPRPGVDASDVETQQTAFAPPAADDWQVIAPGVEMRAWRLGEGGWRVVALRAKAERVKIVAQRSPRGEIRVRTATEWREWSSALAVINGGYFDEKERPLGLRITRGRQFSPLRRADWGVFWVAGGRAHITHTRDFGDQLSAQEAVQCGPRLVVGGRVTDLKAQVARRSGVGVSRDGHVVLAVCDGPLEFGRWAELWRAKTGFNCPNALNLDGGGSTQLSVQSSSRSVEVQGYWPVPDALIIK
jgi:uncharacterized protein YigE (DUF2233 family)